MPEAVACRRIVAALQATVGAWVEQAGAVVELCEQGSLERREALHLKYNLMQAAETIARLAEQMEDG